MRRGSRALWWILGGAAALVATLLVIIIVSVHAALPIITGQTAPKSAGSVEVTLAAPAPASLGEPTALGSGIGALASEEWVRETAARTGIPERALAAYAGAELTLSTESPQCSLAWNTLAGIGSVESDHGRITGGQIDSDGVARPAIVGIALEGISTDAIADTDDGLLDGDTRWDRAVGPMQFIPSTWADYRADGSGDGVHDPHNIEDAALAAARYLCAAGNGSLAESSPWINAITAYNSDPAYIVRVSVAANEYAAL